MRCFDSLSLFCYLALKRVCFIDIIFRLYKKKEKLPVAKTVQVDKSFLS